MVEPQYIKYINIIKAMGIILVVVGHSASGKFANFIYLFHMPLFFFVAGYLYKDKYDSDLIIFVKRKLHSLYRPYLLYSLVFLALHNILFDFSIYSNTVSYGGKIINKYSFLEYGKQLAATIAFASREPMLGAIWFFATMFFAIVIFCLIRNITKGMKHKDIIRNVAIIAIFLIGVYSAQLNINIPRFSNSLSMLMFINLGYIFRKYEDKIPITGIVSIVCFIILLIFNMIGHVSVNLNTYTNPVFLIVASLSGIYLISYLSKLTLKTKWKKQLEFIGESTIVIMALHFISFKIIALIQIRVLDLPITDLAKFPIINIDWWWVLYSLAGLIIPIVLQYLYNMLSLKLKNTRIRVIE